MNYFLILIILALCVGGYFEYTTIQDLDSANKQKFTDLNAKIDALQDANKKLEEDETKLAQSVADLTKQVSGGPMQLNANSAPAAQPAPAGADNAVPPPSNDLGTIITPQKTYQDCHLMSVKVDCIVIKYADGITQVKYADLRTELQKRFGYDPQTGANPTPEQVGAAEKQRQAAGN